MSDNIKVIPSTVIKNPRGKHLERGQKIMIYNYFQKLYKSGEYSKTQCTNMTASGLGVSRGSVWKIITEMNTQGFLNPPNKRKPRDTKFDKMSEDRKQRIKDIINSVHKTEVNPTLDQIYKAIREDDTIPTICRSTVWQIMSKLGIGKKKPDSYIVSQREKQLLIINNYKYNFDKMISGNLKRWRCSNRNCKAYLKTESCDDVIVYHNDEHNHKPSNSKKLNRQKVTNGLKRNTVDNICEKSIKLLRQALEKEEIETLTQEDEVKLHRPLEKEGMATLTEDDEVKLHGTSGKEKIATLTKEGEAIKVVKIRRNKSNSRSKKKTVRFRYILPKRLDAANSITEESDLNEVLIPDAQVSREEVHPETPLDTTEQPLTFHFIDLPSTASIMTVADVGSDPDEILVPDAQFSTEEEHLEPEIPSNTIQHPLTFNLIDVPSTESIIKVVDADAGSNPDEVLVPDVQICTKEEHLEIPSDTTEHPFAFHLIDLQPTANIIKADAESDADEVLATNSQASREKLHPEIPSNIKKHALTFRVIKVPSTESIIKEIQVIPDVVTKIEPRSPSPEVEPEEIDTNIAELNTFEDIWKGVVELPSEFWSMAKVSHSTRSVLYSTYVILTAGPIEEKQLVIKEDLQLECYIYRHKYELSELFPPVVTSVHHVEELLRTLDSRRVCQGGPDDSSGVYDNEGGYLDVHFSVWRHRRCQVFLKEEDERCSNCLQLFNSVS